jgi:hypothetical protein
MRNLMAQRPQRGANKSPIRKQRFLVADNNWLPLTITKLRSRTNKLHPSKSRLCLSCLLESWHFVHKRQRRSLNRSSECMEFAHSARCLTTKAQPRRINEVARVSGPNNAHRRWLQRLVRPHTILSSVENDAPRISKGLC